MRKKSNGENVKKSECVIDHEDMWMFKHEYLEKNFEDGKYDYKYKDIVSRSDNTEIVTANFEVEYSYEIIGLFLGIGEDGIVRPIQLLCRKWRRNGMKNMMRNSSEFRMIRYLFSAENYRKRKPNP